MAVDLQLANSDQAEVPKLEEIEQWVTTTLSIIDRPPADIIVRVVDEEEITELNRCYRGKNVPTNVLAFPFEPVVEVEYASLGDVVICFSPDDNTRLVKRIIGQPGDTIEMKNAQLLINGHPLSYSKLDSNYTDQLTCEEQKNALLTLENLPHHSHPVMIFPSINRAKRNFSPLTVPENNYFVMGDNRDLSKDSRTFGFVERKAIVGKAKAVIVSFDITDKYQPRLKRFFKTID